MSHDWYISESYIYGKEIHYTLVKLINGAFGILMGLVDHKRKIQNSAHRSQPWHNKAPLPYELFWYVCVRLVGKNNSVLA